MLSPLPSSRHILAYAQTLHGGGVERVLLRLARAWSEHGRQVTLILGELDGPLSRELHKEVDLIVLGSSRFTALRAVADHARRLKPDVIFCPGNHYTSIAAWTRLRLGADCPPIVGKVSNRLARIDHSAAFSAGYRAWLARHPRFLSHVVAMSPAMQGEAMEVMRIAADRTSVIPNPPARPLPGDAPLRLPDGPFLLGVGRLAPQKRWDRAIAALPRLADREAKLVILGEGEARGALQAQVRALGLDGRVLLPGYVSDPSSAFDKAAAVVLTSDFEGVPGVLRESLAAGCPVVATDSSVAMREIVNAPTLGSIVPPDDGVALVRALNYWLSPGRVRPVPVPEPGIDSPVRYLELFDSLTAQRVR